MVTAHDMRLQLFRQLIRSRVIAFLDVPRHGEIIELMADSKIYAFVEQPTLDTLCEAAIHLGALAAGISRPVAMTIVANAPTGRVDGFVETLAEAGYEVIFLPEADLVLQGALSHMS